VQFPLEVGGGREKLQRALFFFSDQLSCCLRLALPVPTHIVRGA
jgi:hypothetical protein